MNTENDIIQKDALINNVYFGDHVSVANPLDQSVTIIPGVKIDARGVVVISNLDSVGLLKPPKQYKWRNSAQIPPTYVCSISQDGNNLKLSCSPIPGHGGNPVVVIAELEQ